MRILRYLVKYPGLKHSSASDIVFSALIVTHLEEIHYVVWPTHPRGIDIFSLNNSTFLCFTYNLCELSLCPGYLESHSPLQQAELQKFNC